ncbi:MAG: DUF3394 domain-containing protein, partial [Alphaproteobacteria bacterium]|nr:DUF3394 domain-containing protein [Alphaproteobacteria bacterium]
MTVAALPDGKLLRKLAFAGLVCWAVWQFLVLNPYIGILSDTIANPHAVQAIHLSLVIVAGFLLLPSPFLKRYGKLQAVLLPVAAILPCAAIFAHYGSDVFLREETLPAAYIWGIGLSLLAVAELLRRLTGWRYALIFLLGTCFYVYNATRASSLPGEGLNVLGATVWKLLFSPDGLFSTNLLLVATVLFPLALFGEMLTACGLDKTARRIAEAIFGRSRGGEVKSTVAAAAMIGTFRMDMPGTIMEKNGEHAGGILPAATAYAHLMPPALGIMAWLLTEFTSASPLDVVAWCVLPALFGFAALFYAVHLDHQRQAGDAEPSGNLISTIFPPLLVMLLALLFLCFGMVLLVTVFDLRSQPPGQSAVVALLAVYFLWVWLSARLKPMEPAYGVRSLAFILLREGYLALPVGVLAWGVIFARLPLQLAVLWGALAALVLLLTMHPVRRFFSGDADLKDYPAFVYGHLYHSLARASAVVVYVTLMIVTALPLVLLAKNLAFDQQAIALLHASALGVQPWLPALALAALAVLAVAAGVPYLAFFLVLAQIVLALGDNILADGYALITLLFTVLLSSLAVYFYSGTQGAKPYPWRLGVPLLLLPLLILSEAYFMEFMAQDVRHVLPWMMRMAIGLLLVVAALHGYFIARMVVAERVLMALAALCCLFPQEVLRVTYPPYTLQSPDQVFAIAEATSVDDAVAIWLRGENPSGEKVKLRVTLPLPEGVDGGDRLKKAGLTLRKEGESWK